METPLPSAVARPFPILPGLLLCVCSPARNEILGRKASSRLSASALTYDFYNTSPQKLHSYVLLTGQLIALHTPTRVQQSHIHTQSRVREPRCRGEQGRREARSTKASEEQHCCSYGLLPICVRVCL